MVRFESIPGPNPRYTGDPSQTSTPRLMSTQTFCQHFSRYFVPSFENIESTDHPRKILQKLPPFLPPTPGTPPPSHPPPIDPRHNAPQGRIYPARRGRHACASPQRTGPHRRAGDPHHPLGRRRRRLCHAQPGTTPRRLCGRGPRVQAPAPGHRLQHHLPHVSVPPLQHHPR